VLSGRKHGKNMKVLKLTEVKTKWVADQERFNELYGNKIKAYKYEDALPHPYYMPKKIENTYHPFWIVADKLISFSIDQMNNRTRLIVVGFADTVTVKETPEQIIVALDEIQ
jgi:hypothetical protein